MSHQSHELTTITLKSCVYPVPDKLSRCIQWVESPVDELSHHSMSWVTSRWVESSFDELSHQSMSCQGVDIIKGFLLTPPASPHPSLPPHSPPTHRTDSTDPTQLSSVCQWLSELYWIIIAWDIWRDIWIVGCFSMKHFENIFLLRCNVAVGDRGWKLRILI